MARFSPNETRTRLGVSRPTLYKWTLEKKIRRHKKDVGGRTYYEYDEKDIAALKSKMKRRISSGGGYSESSGRSAARCWFKRSRTSARQAPDAISAGTNCNNRHPSEARAFAFWRSLR